MFGRSTTNSRNLLIASIFLFATAAFFAGLKAKNFVKRHMHLPALSAFKKDFILKDYTQVLCPTDSISIATFGQSNSANDMTEKSDAVIPENLYQYDWRSQKCYQYKEPLLGASGTSGNTMTHTATRVANALKKPVVVIPFAVGGTSILEWAYGDLSRQHFMVLERLKGSGLSPNIFLWHQGETDAKSTAVADDLIASSPYFSKYFAIHGKWLIGLEENDYYEALKKIANQTLINFPESSFGVALASRCFNKSSWEPVRLAQSRVALDLANAFISADSDTVIGAENRPDNCHFSSNGASELANLYYPGIMNILERQGEHEANE